MSCDDLYVARLARMFGEHPSWREAARRLEDLASSAIFFSHRPGEAWRLERNGGQTRLVAGPAPDPDFAFRFTPAAIDRLAAIDGGIGDFAVELFRLMSETEPRLQVGFRVRTSFARLVRRGYLGLLAAGGTRVLAFGAARGVRTIADLRRLVDSSLRGSPEPWETDLREAPPEGRAP